MDTSTWLIVFLLLGAASLASYLLSYWSTSRGGSSVGWAATSIGTTLLLTAAAIAVLAFVFRSLLWPPQGGEHQGGEQARRGSATTLEKISALGVAEAEAPTEATSKSATSVSGARTAPNRRAAEAASAIKQERVRTLISGEPSTEAQNKPGRSSAPLPVFVENDPWAATRCVYVFNPDLSDPTRWKIENGCDVPVGIILSSCPEGPVGCNDRASWKYPPQDTMFPAQLQRPVTHDEQTVYAQEVRYVACFVATPDAIQMLGEPREKQLSRAASERFESARATDGCLMRVQTWTDQGRRTHLPIDVLLGEGTRLTGRDASTADY